MTTHQGIVTIDANLNLDERELPCRLSPASRMPIETRVPATCRTSATPAARDSRVTFRFDVPTLGVPETPLIRVPRDVVRHGDRHPAAVDPGMQANRSDGFATPSAIPAAWIATPPVFDTAQAVTADEAIEIESDELEVAAGDTVIVRLSRDADSGYDGEVGSLKFKGVLIGGLKEDAGGRPYNLQWHNRNSMHSCPRFPKRPGSIVSGEHDLDPRQPDRRAAGRGSSLASLPPTSCSSGADRLAGRLHDRHRL